MILIHIKKENREPEVGEWYYYPQLDAVGQRTCTEISYNYCKALSLSVILDAPDDPKDLIWAREAYHISKTEEIFQWLHDQGKLGEEWVEFTGEAVEASSEVVGSDSYSVHLRLPNKQDQQSLKEEKPENKINGKSLNCQKLECYQIYSDWQQRLFNHMAQDHDINLTDTQMQDIYSCIVKFDSEKETKIFNT